MRVEEILGGSQKGHHRLVYLTMRHFTPELFPEPLNRIKPGAVGGEIEQHRAVKEEMDRIFDQEIAPFEARMGEVELQLDGLRQQERGLRQELRIVKSQIEPMEQQLEDRLLGLLEDALVSVADEAEPATP